MTTASQPAGIDRRFASRKFLLTCVAYATGVPLVCVGILTPDQWVSFTTWVLGLYLAANVSDQAVTK